jgi:hypothetical protein
LDIGARPEIPAGGNAVKLFKSLAVTSAFLLTGDVALAGPPQSATTRAQTRAYQAQSMNNNGKATAGGNQKAEIHKIIGTVDQASNSSLQVSHKYMGQQKNTDFAMTARTKRQGNISNGTRVEIYYKNANNEHVATMVKAESQAG